MIQPYMPGIAAEGEYSLFYFGGKFSHSIIKRPAEGDFRVQDQFGGYEEAIDPPDGCRSGWRNRHLPQRRGSPPPERLLMPASICCAIAMASSASWNSN